MPHRNWIVLHSAGLGGALFCQVSTIALFEEHYHKEEADKDAYTDHGILRVQRAMVRIDGQSLEVFESPPKIALLIRGWDKDDARLWSLGRITAEGGPRDGEYFELCNPETSDARIDEILTGVDGRAAIWCNGA